MSTTTDSDDGTLEIIDYTDGFYAYDTKYVDLFVKVPPAGVDTEYSWSVEVDGTMLTSGSFHLVFSSGPDNYYLARVTVPYGRELIWHSSGGDTLGGAQDFTIPLLVGDISIAFVKDGGVWKPAIPYIKTYNISVIDGSHIPIWKQAKAFVHNPSGWAETTG